MATEDFTTYIEEDPNTRLAVIAAKVTHTGLTKNEDAYVYKDKGAGHFNGDYEHLFEMMCTAAVASCTCWYWVLANQIEDHEDLTDAHAVNHFRLSTTEYIGLDEKFGGDREYDIWGGASLSTLYYLKVKRDEAVGEFGTLYLYVYSDDERTDLLDTLTLTLREKEDFQYIYGVNTINVSGGEAESGYTQNLDLQEAAPPSNAMPMAMDHYRRRRND